MKIRYIYIVMVYDDEVVSCPTSRDAISFITDTQAQYNELIHKISIYNAETGVAFEIKMDEYNAMEKQELFEKAVEAMDRYAESIKIDLPVFADYYDRRMKELLKEIKKRGWHEEFKDFAWIV